MSCLSIIIGGGKKEGCLLVRDLLESEIIYKGDLETVGLQLVQVLF